MKTSIIKKNSLISAAFGIALISSSSFVGCGSGDDNGTDAGTTAIVQLAEGLGECSASNEGAVFWDESENKAYVCSMGNWVDDAQTDNSLSSEHNTDELSSSSKNGGIVDNPGSMGLDVSSNSEKTGSSTSNLSSSTILSSSSQKTISSSSKQDNASSSSSSKKTSSASTGSKFANGVLTDYRDGHTYGAVTIGLQTWMSENLNFASDNSSCYNNDENNCAKYGRLYKWAAAVNKSESSCGEGYTCSLPSGKIQGVCPSEWHLPSKAEFETLISAIGGRNIAGKILKATTINGSDDFAFAALPAGYEPDGGDFLNEGRGAYFWSSEEGSGTYGPYEAYHMSLNSASVVAYLSTGGKSNGYSVRCIKDVPWNPYVISSSSSQNTSSSSSQSNSSSSIESTPDDGTFTDSRDGKKYKTVTIIVGIGKWQIWMAENLNYNMENSYCYEDDVNNCQKYGRLYTWSAATNACPEGWTLPSTIDWNTLMHGDGNGEGWSAAGRLLKSTEGWYNNGNGPDRYHFTALPAGFRTSGGTFRNESNGAYFWSSMDDGDNKADLVSLNYAENAAGANEYDKEYGLSVRCIKNPNGNSSFEGYGSLTDSRDGQVYQTVEIGEQTWMAQNLNYKTTRSFYHSVCYENNESNCVKYGRLYTWATAMDSAGEYGSNGKGCGYGKECSPKYPTRGICPEGWHLPTIKEWQYLRDAVGSTSAGKKLKSTSGWLIDNGLDLFGFSALPAGAEYGNLDFGDVREYAIFWSATPYSDAVDPIAAKYVYLEYNQNEMSISQEGKKVGMSIRCLKDN